MRQLLEDLHRRYPRAVIVGHHDLNPHKAAIKREQNQTCLDFAEREQARPNVKDCPCIINVAKEYADLQPM
jgi:N-acetyl-anhydromuramyl-L-alanine amidase AmpD